MCLAIPGKLIEIAPDANGVRMGKANFGGIVKQVCLEYTPDVSVGDYVLVHVGFALSKVDEEEAARTYQLLEEMKQLANSTRLILTIEPSFPGIPGSALSHEISRRISRRSSGYENCRRNPPDHHEPWVLMEVCGGQTHTIVKYGIDRLLPDQSNSCTGRAARFASPHWR